MRLLFWLCAALLIIIVSGPAPAPAASVTAILGTNVACDTTLPSCTPIPVALSSSSLCAVACPKDASFSYTDSSRFWGVSVIGGDSCQTSTNGGVGWAACATQPFVAGVQLRVAGASDGSTIAAGSVAGPTCTIRRSTDNAASWTTVFTEPGINCGASSNEGQQLLCLSNGKCLYISFGVNNGTVNRIYRSSNNGVTWIAGETTANTWIQAIGGMDWDGSTGISKSVAAGQRAMVATADLWANSAVWALTCTMPIIYSPVIYNGVGRIICFDGAASNYVLFDNTGVAVTTLPLDNPTLAGSVGGTALGFRTNTLYVAASRPASVCPGGCVGIYVSRNNLVSFSLLGNVAVPTIGGMRSGNSFAANGCVYFCVGQAGADMGFFRVC